MLAVVSVPAWAQAANDARAASSAGLERLDAFLREVTGPQAYLGAVALVAKDHETIYFASVGSRDLARSMPMTKDAIFRIYSMTKPIVTVAALMLVAQGRLSLDAPIERTLPAFANPTVFVRGTADAPELRPASRSITLRDLLTHTGGFATGGAGFEEPTRLLERADLHGASDLADFARRLGRLPLAVDPGTQFRYDGTGIEVVARMIEVASGMSFADFLERRIFAPLGMRDTGFSVPPSQRARVVDLPTRGPDATLIRADTRSAIEPGAPLQDYASGAGGLYSTAHDYLRFCTMLLDGGRYDGGTLLSSATIDSMMRDQLPSGVSPGDQLIAGETFGFGGSIVVDPARRQRRGSVGAFGWSGAASTYFTIDRKERLVAILLMQYLPRGDATDLPKVAARFYDRVYEAFDR